MRGLFFSFLCFISILTFSQEKKDDGFEQEITAHDVDSVNWDSATYVDLGEMNFYSLKLNSDLEKKYYIWLEKRVRDVYPFLEKAVTEYYWVKDSAELIDGKRERRKFIKKRYGQLADQYEEKLKNLSTSRGQILSKLIHRETDKTSYEIIKELRGGMSAFMWNTAGGAFDIDLKQEFSPSRTREDLFIEVIIQRGIRDGIFKPIRPERENRLEKISPILKALGKE